MNTSSTWSQQTIIFMLTVCTFVAAGCTTSVKKSEAAGPASQTTGLALPQARMTDERILGDRRTLEAVQLRLQKLSEAGIAQNSYSLAKAQCWLDTAKSQYQENDRTGYIEESMTEAIKITQALEADKSAKAGLDTPLVARSSLLRNDLWARLNSFKSQPATLACNAKTVACAEVRLVRAGHANEQTGWRQATPFVQMVEDALLKAKTEADSCLPAQQLIIKAALVDAPAVSVATSVTSAPAAALTKESYVLLTDTLFNFDKSARQDMSVGGLLRLADVAQRLKGYKSIQTLTVSGYTDRLGSDQYNNKLSEDRAKTVQTYLQSLGVVAATSIAQGKGKREPVTRDCASSASREQQIKCLQPDRRVTIEVTGVVR